MSISRIVTSALSRRSASNVNRQKYTLKMESAIYVLIFLMDVYCALISNSAQLATLLSTI